MATISSLGVGSGIDLNGILKSLMSAEQQPLIQLASREASAQAKISALGSLKSAIEAISGSAATLVPTAGKTALEFFSSTKSSLTDTEIGTVTTTSSAVKGTYSLEVTKLATAQRLATLDSRFTSASDAVLESGFTTGSLTLEIGSNTGGTFVAKDGTTPITISIDSTNNSLSGLRDAINAAKAGVTATIITGDTGPKLVLSSNEVGTGSLIRLTDVGGGLAGFEYDPIAATGDFSEDSAQGGQSAQSSEIKINGIAITSATNTVTNAIDGVTLNLLKTNIGSPTAINISKNDTLSTNLGAFVKFFNDSAKTLKELGLFGEGGKNNGPLLGDAALRNVQTRLRNLVSATPTGLSSTAPYKTLSSIGISFERNGTLKLDATKLQAAVDKDAEAVANLVAAFGTEMKSATSDSKGLPGIVTAATDGLNATIKGYGRSREVIAARLTSIEARYRKQFTAMDTLVASMNKTATYLQQQLANLPKIGA